MSQPDFLWGVTDSSLSAEGVAPTADWSRWERDGRVPTSGDGAGFAIDHADDLRLTAALGFTDVRITVEWAPLEPRPGVVDTDAGVPCAIELSYATRAKVPIEMTRPRIRAPKATRS